MALLSSSTVDASGQTAGAAIGLLIGGSGGALAGAAVGGALPHALRAVTTEISQRFLSPREKQRIVTVLDAAAIEIDAHLTRGEQPRADGFFDEAADGRVPAQEIAEGVLLASQHEYEERKMRLFGRLLAALAFDSSIARATANHLVRLAGQLSYRQLLLLQLFAVPGAATRQEDFRGGDVVQTDELVDLLTELFELYQRGLINNGGSAALSAISLIPGKIEIQGVGSVLARLLFADRHVEDAGELNRMSRILHP